MATKDEKDSLALHATLECTAASKIASMIRKQMQNLIPLLVQVVLVLANKRIWGKEIKILGSIGEGVGCFSVLNGTESDVDFMVVSDKSVVYEHRYIQVPDSTWLFQIQPCTNNTGYVQLMLKHRGNIRLYDPNIFGRESLLQYDSTSGFHYLTNTMNQQYANLQSMVSVHMPNISASDVHSDVINSGPCLTFMNNSVIRGDLDYVPGIRCPEWPSMAIEWILRDRFNGWPSHSFIHQQVQRGCYVIPVGCKECTRKHLDWRISFAHVEQALVNSMNAKHIHCFLLLRQLKKFFFEVKMPNVIASYIIKTTLFWTIEETSPELWQSHKLLTAVKVCLNKLITFIQNDFCPHYFIRTCNLLLRRYSPADKRSVLETCLEARRNPMEILSLTPPFAQKLRLHRCNQQLSFACSSHETPYLEDDMLTKTLMPLLAHVFTSMAQTSLQIILSDMESKQAVAQYCITVTKEINALISNHTNDCRRYAEILQTYIHGVTQRLLRSCQFGNAPSQNMTNSWDPVLLHNVPDDDDVTRIANTCHLHMVAGNYSRCRDILIKFVDVQKHRVYRTEIYEGTGVTGYESELSFYLLNVLLMAVNNKVPCMATDNKIPCISDIMFVHIEEDTLPTPLQTELNPISIGKPEIDALLERKATLLVDPLVYVCLLRFWCSMKMDQNIEKLKARDDMVWCCGLITISERAVALNLLAFCHSKLEEYEKTFAVLCRAFSERPLQCSTLIHIANLVNKKLRVSPD